MSGDCDSLSSCRICCKPDCSGCQSIMTHKQGQVVVSRYFFLSQFESSFVCSSLLQKGSEGMRRAWGVWLGSLEAYLSVRKSLKWLGSLLDPKAPVFWLLAAVSLNISSEMAPHSHKMQTCAGDTWRKNCKLPERKHDATFTPPPLFSRVHTLLNFPLMPLGRT